MTVIGINGHIQQSAHSLFVSFLLLRLLDSFPWLELHHCLGRFLNTHEGQTLEITGKAKFHSYERGKDH
jgi:hypothetical protein